MGQFWGVNAPPRICRDVCVLQLLPGRGFSISRIRCPHRLHASGQTCPPLRAPHGRDPQPLLAFSPPPCGVSTSWPGGCGPGPLRGPRPSGDALGSWWPWSSAPAGASKASVPLNAPPRPCSPPWVLVAGGPTGRCPPNQDADAVGAAPTCGPTGGRDAADALALLPASVFPPRRARLLKNESWGWGAGWDSLLAPAARTPSAEMRQNLFCAPVGVLPAPGTPHTGGRRRVCSLRCCFGTWLEPGCRPSGLPGSLRGFCKETHP